MRRLKLSLFPLLFIGILGLMGCKGEPPSMGPQYGAPVPPKQKNFIFAVHPLQNPRKLMLAYQPLVEYLNTRMSEGHIILEPSMDYASYEAKFEDGRLSLLLPNPYQTLQAMEAGFEVIAMAGECADFRGIFIARKDSSITSPHDLRGRVVSYPAPTALAACVMPQYFFHLHGVNIKTDLTNIYVGSQASSIMAVVVGKSAVAATWPPSWRDFQKDYPEEAAKLELIWQTEPLINNSVMVKNDVPQSVKVRVQQALLSLHQSEQGREILEGIETSRFYKAFDDDYQQVRTYIHTFQQQVRLIREP